MSQVRSRRKKNVLKVNFCWMRVFLLVSSIQTRRQPKKNTFALCVCVCCVSTFVPDNNSKAIISCLWYPRVARVTIGGVYCSTVFNRRCAGILLRGCSFGVCVVSPPIFFLHAPAPRPGISITAGHDCLFEQSYPLLLNATMGRLMAATGVR